MNKRVAVFARQPRLGQVKTRLASQIGVARALDCYIETLEIAIEAASNQKLELWYEGHPCPSWIERCLCLKQQSDGDLGTRMFAAFCDGVDLVIGSDIPLISSHYVDQAVDLLSTADVVLGPTEDGGYCLIAMRQPLHELFQGIAWSSSQVLEQTLAKARHEQLRVELLPRLWDIDDETDYHRWNSIRATREPQDFRTI